MAKSVVYKNKPMKRKKTYVPKRDRVALPILNNQEDEVALVQYILERMQLSSGEHSRRVQRMTEIDRQLAGYVDFSEADKLRDKDNKEGKPPKPVDHSIPLAQSQLEDACTYLMTVFAPEMDIFEAVAPADKQRVAQAVTAEINRQGQKGAYYRNLAKFIQNGLRYNLGALTCMWEKYEGLVFKGTVGGPATKTDGVLWEGNKLLSCDMYNFFFDTSVRNPVDLPAEGEFFAEVSRVTKFRVRKMEQDNQLYGIARFADDDSALMPASGSSGANQTLFYTDPPSVRQDNGSRGGTDFVEMLGGGTAQSSSVPGVELVKFIAWLKPAEFGLSNSEKLELWKIVLANGTYIAFAAKLEDTHGQLPIVLTTPLEDDLRNEQRSYAEQLIPLQHYASFLINTDQAATRKKLFGITVYNPHLISGMDLSKEELIGARIPIRSTATDFNIDSAFRHFTDGPDTDRCIEKFAAVVEIMQKILPTDFLKQVADLERATLYQAAATVQAGNRRHLKTARMISDQAMTPLKFQMVYNLYARLPGIEIFDPNTGQRTSIGIGEIVDAMIELDIGTGLKGIDRLMQIQIFRDILNSVIQSQQALQEIDIVKMLNYFASMAGDRTDLTQFRRTTPAPVAGTTPGNPQIGGHVAGDAQ